MLDTSQFSAEQLRLIHALPSHIKLPLLQGSITFQQLIEYAQTSSTQNPSFLLAQPPGPTAVPFTTTSGVQAHGITHASASAPSNTPSTVVPPPSVPTVSSTESSSPNLISSPAPNTQVSPAPSTQSTSSTSLKFEQMFSVLRKVRGENPYAGSNSEKSAAWNRVYQHYLELGGDSARNIDWLKKKIGECLDYHEDKNLTKITKITKDMLSTGDHHVVVASTLEAITEQRDRARNETVEASSKRRKVEQEKADVGKLLVNASLQGYTRRVLESCNTNPTDVIEISDEEDDNTHTISATAADSDEILVKGNDGVYIPVAEGSSNNLIKTEAHDSGEMITPARRTHANDDLSKKLDEETENIKPKLEPTENSSPDRKRRRERVAERITKKKKQRKGGLKRSRSGNIQEDDGASMKLIKQMSDGVQRSLSLTEKMVTLSQNQQRETEAFHQDFLGLIRRMLPDS